MMSDTGQHAGGGAESGEGQYRPGSLSLYGAVSMGTGVMIGAGIFALTGQIAELAGGLFPLAFLAAAVVAGFSTYSYIKVASAYPSAGGIGMILKKCYGQSTATAGFALLMYFSMVINESLVARTFGAYTLRLFDAQGQGWRVPALGVGLLAFAFLVNLSGNKVIGRFQLVMAAVKVVGIAALAVAGLWASGLSFESVGTQASGGGTVGVVGFLAATTIGLLAFKGFTTITNSGAELKDPKRNLRRAILWSVGICLVVYLLVTFAVAGNLDLERIIAARDTALAEAAQPAFGRAGLWITVALAIIATVSGVIASVFAVSRMLAMLTEMQLVPHSHFGMPGRVQHHTLVYTVLLAMILTILFDLSRIAGLGAIFYLVMDLAIHWGVLRHLRQDVSARPWVLVTAIVLDLAILTGFVVEKLGSDPWLLVIATGGIAVIFLTEAWFLRRRRGRDS